MTPLNPAFSPPPATIQITLQNPLRTDLLATSEALIDTGSDFTAIPATLIDALALKRKGTIRLKGIEERENSFDSYIVNLQVADTRLERILAIGWQGKFVILGRDAMNDLTFWYDGKNKQFELRDP